MEQMTLFDTPPTAGTAEPTVASAAAGSAARLSEETREFYRLVDVFRGLRGEERYEARAAYRRHYAAHREAIERDVERHARAIRSGGFEAVVESLYAAYRSQRPWAAERESFHRRTQRHNPNSDD